MTHEAVLINEVIDYMKPKKGGVYFDGTYGGGGHSQKILEKTDFQCQIIGVDQDLEVLKKYSKVSGGSSSCGTLAEAPDSSEFLKKPLHLVHDNFGNIKSILNKLHIEKLDGILLDLGMSSFQLDDASRGFSFLKNGPLDMRMDEGQDFSAPDLVNSASEEELTKIFREYGEEKHARKIAQKIVEKRPLQTTTELSDIIVEVKGHPSYSKKHPATLVFQALRLAVNKELEVLKKVLEDGIEVLKSGGYFCVISFHSLEDRIVKEAFSYAQKECICPEDFPICHCGKKRTMKVITKKPVQPSLEEVRNNRRARSAKLRVAERVLS